MTFVSGGVPMTTLIGMLTTMRPTGSKTEKQFIREFIKPLGVTQDNAGNLIKRIGDSQVMWSCHTDTVHRQEGRQLVTVGDSQVFLGKDSASNCLGADDTAGVWLMSEMIKAQRPGLYVFHRGEEVGGIGSNYIAHSTPQLVSGILAAIALDRMGTKDVITHQGTRCCSDDFAFSLAHKLGMGYRPDDTGVFTDTANYTGIIGECTNLSIGYYHEHTTREYLDLAFVTSLRDCLLSLDTRDLAIVRKPGEQDDSWLDYRDYRAYYPTSRMSDIVRDYPVEVADILEAYGLTAEDLAREIGILKPRGWR